MKKITERTNPMTSRKAMDDSVSAFIVGTCRMIPKSYTAMYQSIHFQSLTSCEMYGIICGSSAEFYIQPLRTCIGDVDIMCVRPNVLAFTDIKSILPYILRALPDTADCLFIEPCHDYPSFIRLRRFGQIRYDWDHKNFNFFQFDVQQLVDTTEESATEEKCTHGPAIKHKSIYTPLHDLVGSIWCPQWPTEARKWPFRQRKYGWPTTAKIQEVIQNGCHVVCAKHPARRGDVHQCRLSFSVAEVILLQSWTPIQQIVYHMLRFFVKRELLEEDCSNEVQVLRTYHIKTLMLWSCEEMLQEWWKSTSVIEICCNLLEKLAKWLKEATCQNYFIPQANLFHEDINPKIYKEFAKRFIKFSDFDTLSLWFVKHYVNPSFVHVFNARDGCELSRRVIQFMLDTCEAMERCKTKSVDLYFSRGFDHINSIACGLVKMRCRLPDAGKLYLRTGSDLLDLHEFLPSLDVESSFEFYASTILILHSAYLIDCTKMQYDSELLVYLVRLFSIKPRFTRSMYHNFPEPWKSSLNRSQLFFRKATDLMDYLTESCDDLKSQLVSHMSRSLLRKALAYKDSKANAITRAALTYMAALHFAASEYQVAVDLCSTVVISQTSTDDDKESLNAGCLYYIDDIVGIIGFYLLFRQIKEHLHYSRKLYLLDLRLTPEVFAHYLIISSNERTNRSNGLNYDIRTPTFPLDEILMTITNRKSFKISKKRGGIVRVYQRTGPIKIVEALNDGSQINNDHCIQLLMEYSLENMTLFYDAIRKDFDIHCSTVDCYRAGYLYKCRQYPEVLHLCERILDEPDLQSDLKEFAFANVMVVPPLDSYFDREVQCLLGFHTLIYYILASTEDLEEATENTFKQFMLRKISAEKWLLSSVLRRAFSLKFHYFLGRHFLARYLKVRCLIDCNHSLSEVMFEFRKLKAILPFECIIRCFLKQKLRQLQKGVNANYCTG